MTISRTAAAMVTRPINVKAGKTLRARCSRDERVSASPGWYEVASMAGNAAATSATPIPATIPLISENDSMLTSVTLTRK